MTSKKAPVGWVCPKCGCVNSPFEQKCINKCKVVIVKSEARRTPNITE